MSSSDIVLSAGIRQNLLSLQQTSQLQQTTQERLATGKKVNSALDNAVDYFTASALDQRATELGNLLDSMTNGVNTLQAASNGLTSITQTIQSMQATATQALQDASWQSSSYSLDTTTIGTSTLASIGFSGGAVGTTQVNVALNGTQTTTAATSVATAGIAGTLTIVGADINDGAAVNIGIQAGEAVSSVAAAINSAVGDSTNTFATVAGGKLTLADNGPNTITLTDSTGGTVLTGIGFSTQSPTGTVTSTAGPVGTAVSTVDELVRAINSNPKLDGYIKANDNAGQLQITNLSITALTVAGIGIASGEVDGSGGTASIGGNQVRLNLVSQFNQLKDQLDKTAADASFNGINLLTGDQLKLYFNESSTSSLVIQSTNPDGVNSSTLGLTDATDAQFQSNTQLNSLLLSLQSALGQVSSQASNFGSNLSIVQNRQDFTNNMVNTLQTGAEDLTIADTNEEGANMLALQTRQQLSIEALSLASQDQQSVLKLFG